MNHKTIAPIDPAQLSTLFEPREPDSHKGSFGTVGIIGGGPGMTGAALLAARAALRLGAGKVLVGFTQAPAPLPCDLLQPELMCRDALSLIQDDPGVTVWVAGCGAGRTLYALESLRQLLTRHTETKVVLDADALNAISSGALKLPACETATRVLTPHPAEAARLLGSSTAQVQADRAAAAAELAHIHRAWVVLKGAHTLVCAPDGHLARNTTGNAALATAGTGDVLAGFIGSLLAQGLPTNQAVTGAVWLHGAAADASTQAGVGPIGFTAGELADWARRLRNAMVDAKTTL